MKYKVTYIDHMDKKQVVTIDGIGFFYDGTHKFYVAKDKADIDLMENIGYDKETDFFEMAELETMFTKCNTYDNYSFINSVDLSERYVTQGATRVSFEVIPTTQKGVVESYAVRVALVDNTKEPKIREITPLVEFVNEAENQGTIMTLDGFMREFNSHGLDLDNYTIRIYLARIGEDDGRHKLLPLDKKMLVVLKGKLLEI